MTVGLADQARALAWAQRLQDEHRRCGGRLIIHRADVDDVDGWPAGEINGALCPVHGLFFRPPPVDADA